MTVYTVDIAGKQYFPHNIFISKNVDFRTPNDFELVFPRVESYIDLDDVIDIKRDGTTIFRGRVETLETYKTGEDLQFRVAGRDMSVALLRLTTGRDIFQSKDPSVICETLNSPGKLIALQPQKFIVYPEMDTYISSYYNQGYPSYVYLYTRWYVIAPGNPYNHNQRALIKFDLTNILGKIQSVTSAILNIRVWKTSNLNGQANPYYNPRIKAYYRVLGPWDESVKWSNQPAIASSYTATTTHYHGETDTCFQVDLTSDVQAWKSGATNYGWMIRDPSDETPNGGSYQTMFYSSESATPPYLVLTVSYSNGIVATASASHNSSDAYKVIDQ
ncbi:DNRLRE domain-containing protein, partial [Candidatus Bathyarchaeota archaeon]|nr:DNRLRE domain-containing protein [Candidatus Bathyarchaeota archaeon]